MNMVSVAYVGMFKFRSTFIIQSAHILDVALIDER